MAAPCSAASRLPNFTSPVEGAVVVASTDSSVDFPAPLGPSRPVMVPASQRKLTFASARRRP